MSSSFLLTPIAPVPSEPCTSSEEFAGTVTRLEVTADTRFLVAIDLGDHSGVEAHDYLMRASTKLKTVFPENTVYVAQRDGVPTVTAYSVKEVRTTD